MDGKIILKESQEAVIIKREREILEISENGMEVLRRRYLRKGEDGQPAETPKEMLDRIASTVAAPDANYHQDAGTTQEKFFSLLADLRFLPNSPTFTGAGTPLGQLSACFVLPIADDMGKQQDGIFSTLLHAALIQQTGGGNGFSFSRLRPKGALVKASMGVASGPVGFLKVYDAAFGEIAQGGTRRGANMAVLRCDHPDIFEFIHCKTAESAVTNFNISVAITDQFMQAVEKDSDFELVNPHDRKVAKKVRAREIFDEIVKYAHKNGEPGVLFIDRANRDNPLPNQYELEATNPCAEQWLGPYENCCLGSINLARHVTQDGKVNWVRLEKTIAESVHFLDNVVDANKYVPAVPQLKEAALKNRRIGLGIMGLADLMYRVKVRYGGEDGRELAEQIMEFVRFHSLKSSIELARQRGAFPGIAGSIYDPQNLRWQHPQPIWEYQRDFGRPTLNWDEIYEGLKLYGVRNAAQNTIAPTGTLSTVAGCEGYGCEPVFALYHTRHVVEKEGLVDLKMASPLFEEALLKAGIDEATRQAIINEVNLTGSCQDIALVPEEIKRVFVVANDLTPDEHVEMQAALQVFIDNSISKTCNFPADASPEDVKAVYFKAWKLGCKGLTVYVTGSREKVILETQETVLKKQNALNLSLSTNHKLPRPPRLYGQTFQVEVPDKGNLYITVNHNGERILEVFALGKMISPSVGRAYSELLRYGHPVEAVIKSLRKEENSSAIPFNQRLLRSPEQVMAECLKIVQEDLISGRVDSHPTDLPGKQKIPTQVQTMLAVGRNCPECGGVGTLQPNEGCEICLECGYTKCS